MRADGSVRKVFKVRPGFTPKEDVPKYVPIGRRRKEEQDGSLTEKKKEEEVDQPGRRLSPKVRDINNVLSGPREPARPRPRPAVESLVKSTDDFPALPRKTETVSNRSEDDDGSLLADSLGKLDLGTEKTTSKAELKITEDEKTTPKVEHKNAEDKMANTKETRECRKLESSAESKSSPEVASRAKYVPPWKR